MFTVTWHLGEKRFRRLFANPQEAEDFARHKAEDLACGNVTAASVSPPEAQTYREAMRRLGRHQIPLHVAIDEYASAIEQLGGGGTLRQAVKFFLHKAAIVPRTSRRHARRFQVL